MDELEQALNVGKSTINLRRLSAFASFPGPSLASSPRVVDVMTAWCFDFDLNGGKDLFKFGLQLIHYEATKELPNVESVVRELLAASTEVARSIPDDEFHAQFILHSAVMGCSQPSDDSNTNDTQKVAAWLISKRQAEWRLTSDYFVALLIVGLRLLGRQPKPGFTVRQVVVAAQSVWQSLLYRERLLGSDEVGLGFIVDLQLEIINGLTMEGPFLVGTEDDPGESALVRGALALYSEDQRDVSIEEAICEVQVSDGPHGLVTHQIALELVGDSSELLAERCFERIVAFDETVIEMGSELGKEATSLAEAIGSLLLANRRRYPHLHESFDFANSAIRERLVSFAASARMSDRVSEEVARRQAEILVDDAVVGSARSFHSTLVAFDPSHGGWAG